MCKAYLKPKSQRLTSHNKLTIGFSSSCLTVRTGLAPPGLFNMVCIGTAFPAMPGVPNIRAEAVFCNTDAETICAEDMLDRPAKAFSLAA